LIAKDILDYEDKAVELARNPTKMRSLRDKLERGIRSAALFDGERFRKNIETAFIAMLDARR
jgi:protein O-GlcNAc transferase